VREHILRAALQVFSHEGAAGLSMRRLAQETGYSAANLYKYFENKGALVHAMRDDFFSRLHKKMLVRAQFEPQSLNCLRAAGRCYVETALEEPDMYALGFSEPLDMPAKDLEDGTRGSTFAMLRGLVERLIGLGLLRRDDPQRVAFSLWAAMHGLASILIVAPNFPEVDRAEIIDFHINVVIQGLTGSVHIPK